MGCTFLKASFSNASGASFFFPFFSLSCEHKDTQAIKQIQFGHIPQKQITEIFFEFSPWFEAFGRGIEP
jgi:hypothetical protein